MKQNTKLKFVKYRPFTLFELIISVGLLVVLSVVLLRTFALMSDYWKKSDEQAYLQADAKTVFNLLSMELDNIIYQAEATDNSSLKAPIFIGDYGKKLCFVTHSKLRNSDSYSDICKLEYKYDSSKGTLTRSHAGDKGASSTEAGNFDFSKTTGDAFYEVFDETNLVIDTVLDFKVTAYKADNSVVPPENTFASKDIRYIKVFLKLLPYHRFEEFNDITDTDERIFYMSKYGRIFYKTFYIKPINQ